MSGTGVIVRASARRVSSLSLIAVVVFLAAAGLAASFIVRGDAAANVDAAFARADGADLVLTVRPDAVDGLRAVLRANARVDRVGAPSLSIDGELADQDRTEIEIRSTQPQGTFNAPVLTDGRNPVDGMEVLFDAALAADHGLDVGDSVSIVTGGVARRLEIVGLGYDFTDCLYPTCDPAHVWITDATFAVIADGEPAMIVPVDLDSDGAAAGVVTEVRQRLGDGLLGSNDWPDTRGDLLVEVEFFGAFLGAFGLFVLVSSAIVIAGAIAARTVARRRAIALYKAVGFTSAQITCSILLEHVLVAVAASVAGWAAAMSLSPVLRVGPLRLLDAGTLDWDLRALAVTTAVTLVIVTIATIVPAWRAGHVDVASALTGSGRATRPPRLAARTVSKSGVIAVLPVPASLAVASLVARPVRSAFNVLAVVVAVVAAIVSASILRSVDQVVFDPALTGDPADAILQPPTELAQADVADVLDHDPAVGAWFSFVDDTATIDGGDVHVRAIGGDPATNGFVIGEGRLPSGAGEAVAGYGLLRDRGWHLGDHVTVALRDTRFDVELVGWYRESEDSGELLQIRMEDFDSAVDDAQPAFGVIASAATTNDALVASLTDQFGPGASIRPNLPDPSGVRPFQVALTVMTMLIGAVAIAHVVASTLTTQRESRRRQGIQRAIGLQPSQLLAEGALHGSAVAALALVIGVPLGWWAQRAIGDLLTSEIGIGPGLAFGPSVASLACIATATAVLVALATAGAIWPSLRRSADSLLTSD